MKQIIRTVASFLLVCLLTNSGYGSTSQKEYGLFAIVDVNVVDVETGIVIPHQTVIVQSGIIFTLGSAVSVKIPDQADVVTGQGRYLLPGWIDMHVHIAAEGDLSLNRIVLSTRPEQMSCRC
jgi:adenine deaminase